MATIAIVFAALRIPVVIATLLKGNVDFTLSHPLTWELGTNLALIALGFGANWLLLQRKQSGIFFGWCLLATVVFSICVSFWASYENWMAIPEGSDAVFGFVLTFFGILAVRILLCVLYAKGLMVAANWFPSRFSRPDLATGIRA